MIILFDMPHRNREILVNLTILFSVILFVWSSNWSTFEH